MASATITTTISSLLDPTGSIFDDLMKGAKDATVDFLTEIQSTDFIEMVLENGIEGALEATATSVFSRQALEEIHSVGGIAQLISGRAQFTTLDGLTVKEIAINQDEKFYLDSNDNLYAVKRGNEFKKGQFYISENDDVFLMNGVIERTLPDGSVGVIQVQNGSSVDIAYGLEGQPIFHIRMNQDNELNVGSFFEIADGVIYFENTGAEIEFNDGYVTNVDLGSISLPEDYHINDVDFGSLTPEETEALVQIVLLNGFQLQWPFQGDPAGTVQDIFKPDSPFVNKLNELQVPDSAVLPIPILEETSLGGDAILWLWDTLTPMTPLTDLIEGRLVEIFESQTEPFVPLAYSGSGQPLLRALDRVGGLPNNNIDTAILVGSPLYDTHMDNSNTSLNRIVNIYGSEDPGLNEVSMPIPPGVPIVSSIPTVDGRIYSPTIADEFTSSFGLQTINVELIGIGHTYFLELGQTDPLVQASNDFIARLTEAALSRQSLNNFLDPFLAGQDINSSVITITVDVSSLN